MDVIAYDPFRASSVLWRPRSDAWTLTVVCRATFALVPGVSRILGASGGDAGEAPVDELGRIVVASALAPAKRWPEVLLVGHARAPEGAPVTSLVARLAVGEVDKALWVFGDRFLTPDGTVTGPTRFVEMPLRWERAAGGPGTANPVGVRTGSSAVADPWGRVALPNLVPVGLPLAHDRDVPPVGFGPIAPTWPGRAALLHRHAATWDPARWSERPLPDDFDIAYFNAAPPDQRLRELAGDERIALENLHPRFARLVTSLQVAAPRATATLDSGWSQDVRMRCDTLILDADRGTAMLMWRGHVALDHPQQAGVVRIAPELGAFAETAMPSVRQQAALPFRSAADDAPASGAAAAAVVTPSWEPPSGAALAAPAGEPLWEPASGAAAAAPAGEPSWEPADGAVVAAPAGGSAARQAIADDDPLDGVAVSAAGAPTGASQGALLPCAGAAAPLPPCDAYPIERCARIAAELAWRPDAAEEILSAAGLSHEAWQGLHARWLDEIEAEGARGKRNLLSAYDAAYVAQLEAVRGAIAVEEHARLVVAAERGAAAEALRELRLPADALMRIRRAWIAKSAADPAFGARSRRAITAERER
ncbi:DUF2169 family type VI secretion system accessory protein [Sorangium sp. So ce204]|uniref:DUF2169 family type VI secretion system accessory protein n=1 Tax=Sorangium sp. So ce204 TaxID=3133288 RepID=UPI003F62120E